MAATFDAGPVRDLLALRASEAGVGVNQLADVLRVSRRTLQRVMTRDRLRWDSADHLAVALGHHPSELWPSWFQSHNLKETA